MIIVRSPLRITLGGGGTDLPSYYRQFGGFLISAAIDKYVYVTVSRPFAPGIYLKYAKLERVDHADEVQHPILREALRLMNFESREPREPRIEITTVADIPAGTGLGSSGSFTTALLKALHTFRRQPITQHEMAELACEIEINRLGDPIGKQDQYIAAYGGLTCFTFSKDDRVEVAPLNVTAETLFDLEDHLLLFFTGFSRAATSVLRDQDVRTRQDDPAMLQNLHVVKELGLRSKLALEKGCASQFGELLHEHWLHKRQRSSGMSNPQIDEWYELGLHNGALGGKLVGAGGGGFLLFYAENQVQVRNAMTHAGLEEVRFRFDFEGTKVLLA